MRNKLMPDSTVTRNNVIIFNYNKYVKIMYYLGK